MIKAWNGLFPGRDLDMGKLYQASACLCISGLVLAATLPALGQDGERAETGTFIKDSERDGYGVLVVENNNPLNDNETRDAVAILIDANDTPTFAVYVREGESFEVQGIKDGVYDFYFTVGEVWDGELAAFLEPEFYRTENPLPFETEIKDGQVIYTQWTLTLEEVTGGDEEKIPVPEELFPSLKED